MGKNERTREGVQAWFSPAAQVVDSVREKPVCACSGEPSDNLVRKKPKSKTTYVSCHVDLMMSKSSKSLSGVKKWQSFF
jgi:hypothetical protein